MATAFYGALVIQPTSPGLPVQVEKFDSTDVANAYFTWASFGGNSYFVVARQGYIIDLTTNIVAVGDTDELKLWINQKDTGIRWPQALSFPTLDTRMFNKAPIPVNAGDRVAI
jgi:hypothetical protein